jgi:phosphatidylethanolamine/phosphatidyl-N-methylethanolamine N-methyltransferase
MGTQEPSTQVGAGPVSRHLGFLGRCIRNPAKVGAIAPSSPVLAETITSWIPLEQADAVVEFGPGDGAFTSHIQCRLKPGAVFFALELDEEMCLCLRQRHPGVTVYSDSATRVGEYLSRHGVEKADAIVCGLPWAAFGPGLQDELMAAILDALPPGGRFVTFAYLQGLMLPTGQRFRRRLNAAFSSVTRSPIVWRNLPPAFVYQCVK